MTTLSDMRALSSAEEFFRYLDVPFDPAILGPARLHVMKRMGELLERADLGGDDGSVKAAARATLARAYEEITTSGPLGARVFRVLKDRDPARPEQAQGKGYFAFDDLFDPA